MPHINLNINPDVFLPVYLPYLWDYSNRYNVYYGGRASGKTFFIIQKLLLKGLKEKRNILLMQKQTNKVKDSVWRELNQAISFFGLRPYFEFNKTEFRATCIINGTEFRCIGLDEPEKIKGYADISDVYLDEVTAFNLDDVELIDGTLRSTKYHLPLQIYFSFNPVSKANFVYKYFGFDTNTTPKDTFILKTTYLDNTKINSGFLTYLDNLKRRNFARWKIEALGEFATLDKLVYNNWKVEEFDHTKKEGKLSLGLDFGYTNDPTALVASIIDQEHEKLWVFKCWGDTGKTNTEIASIIKNLGFAKSVIIADSAEQKSIEEIRRDGVMRIRASTKGPDSILHGIQKLQQYDIVVHPSCEEVITEFENYSWQKDKQTNEYINKPIDKFNHFLDALRYSLQGVDDKKLRTMSKVKLGL